MPQAFAARGEFYEHAPVKGPALLRIVKRNLGPPRWTAVVRHERLHGRAAPGVRIAAASVPAAHEADIAKNGLLEPGSPFQTHTRHLTHPCFAGSCSIQARLLRLFCTDELKEPKRPSRSAGLPPRQGQPSRGGRALAAGFAINTEVKAIRPNIGSRVTSCAVGHAEIGNSLVIGNKPAQEPHHLKITIGRE